ncbi:ABC transporter ATP-binding protein [Sporolactobacillus inulinus]|uniref:ABC transporter ATP-binding protein n=1 Tax=Sporolactobacillus inulinus CASD TaxID=1069536 RepID=A0A0U1QP76_9BACL|nr:ABC transporter ATP-binding protein [Sporolactobacillus inulinus]KLI02601.1 ABC transporter ATP-binding protein [Sporolactobacillus inulinus CASD]GEB76716.1 ABC transporter ATP-binding protein [Sporolactobacillus inulinus]
MELTLSRVTKKFGKKTALDSISVTLREGVCGILGANGSGKSTLMRILATVMRPTDGSILLDGKDIFQLDADYRTLIGYLPQQVGYYRNFSAERFLHYMASLKGLTKAQANKKVEEMLQWVGMEQHRHEKIGKYSGGMKQRIGIAQALLNDPKILIVDEPTAGLDPKERIRFRNLLAATATNRIVLLSTHIVSDLEYLANNIMIIKDGHFVQMDTPTALLKAMNGNVWTVATTNELLADYQQNYKVGNIIRRENGIVVRLLADEKPSRQAVKAVPNLEDLYLYHFDDLNETRPISLHQN